jgi:hypothetical protein
MASLPSLHASGNVQVAPTFIHANGNSAGHSNGMHHGNGHGHAGTTNGAYIPVPVAAQHAAVPPMSAPVLDGMQPILPPRPTGRMHAPVPAGAAWWKSWPLIVIGLAGLAIVFAVFFMVFPFGEPRSTDTGDTKRGLHPPPAPERMETNPLPQNQPRAGDPWNSRSPKPVDPPPYDPQMPDIDIPDDPDPDPDQPDSFGSLSGSGAIMMAMMRHACSRAATCGKLVPPITDYCEMTKTLPASPLPAGCPAAQRCLTNIDQMSCSADMFDDITKLSSVMQKFEDCVEAIGC